MRLFALSLSGCHPPIISVTASLPVIPFVKQVAFRRWSPWIPMSVHKVLSGVLRACGIASMNKHVCHIEMLGRFQICFEGQDPVVLSRQQTGVLFAFLALSPDRLFTREALMAGIWPDDPPEDAAHKLRQSLYSLRKQLQQAAGYPGSSADIIVATRYAIQMTRSRVTTDVMQFEELIRSAVNGLGTAEQIPALQQAIQLYHGELLPGIYLEEFDPERRRLAELHRIALHRLMLAFEAEVDLKRAIETGIQLLNLDPLMEEAHCDLMRLYAADGQPAAVLRQYKTLAGTLQIELEETPSIDTTELMESCRKTAQTRAALKSCAPAIADEMPTELPQIDSARPCVPTSISPSYPPIVAVIPSSLARVRLYFGLAALGVSVCVLLALQAFGGRTMDGAVNIVNNRRDAVNNNAPIGNDLNAATGRSDPQKEPVANSGVLHLDTAHSWMHIYLSGAGRSPRRFRLQNVGSGATSVLFPGLMKDASEAETIPPGDSVDVAAPEIQVRCRNDGYATSIEYYAIGDNEAALPDQGAIRANPGSGASYEVKSPSGALVTPPVGVINLTVDPNLHTNPWFYVYYGVATTSVNFCNKYPMRRYRLWNDGPATVRIFLQGVIERENSIPLISGHSIDVSAAQILVQIDGIRTGGHSRLRYRSLPQVKLPSR